MKVLLSFFVICALTVCVLAVAAQEQNDEKNAPQIIHSPSHFKTAGKFIEMSEADRMLYTSGLIDGFLAGALFGASNETVESLDSCTKGMDNKQLSAILTKYVKDQSAAIGPYDFKLQRGLLTTAHQTSPRSTPLLEETVGHVEDCQYRYNLNHIGKCHICLQHPRSCYEITPQTRVTSSQEPRCACRIASGMVSGCNMVRSTALNSCWLP